MLLWQSSPWPVACWHLSAASRSCWRWCGPGSWASSPAPDQLRGWSGFGQLLILHFYDEGFPTSSRPGPIKWACQEVEYLAPASPRCWHTCPARGTARVWTMDRNQRRPPRQKWSPPAVVLLDVSKLAPLVVFNPENLWKSAGNHGVTSKQLYHFAQLSEHPRNLRNWVKGKDGRGKQAATSKLTMLVQEARSMVCTPTLVRPSHRMGHLKSPGSRGILVLSWATRYTTASPIWVIVYSQRRITSGFRRWNSQLVKV